MTDPTATKGAESRLRSWSFVLGAVVSLICLVWAVGVLDWAAVARAFADTNLLWISLGVAIVLFSILARLARWAALLYPRHFRRNNLLAAMLIGQMLNYFAPARTGDLTRAYLLGYTEGESKLRALGTIALEKLWDIWTLLALVGFLFVFMALPDWLVVPARGLAFVSLLVAVLIGLAIRFRARTTFWVAWLGRYLPSHLHVRIQQSADRLLDGFDGLRRPRILFWSAVWSAVTWILGSLSNHAVLLAFGLSVPFTASIMLMVVLQIGVAVPSLPGRVGLYEAMVILVLALFGIDRDTAFAAGLALHVVSFVPPILLGIFFVWRVKGLRQIRISDEIGLGG